MKIHKQNAYVSIEITPKTPSRASVIVRAVDSGGVVAFDEFNIISGNARAKFLTSLPEPIAALVGVLLRDAALEIVAGEQSVASPLPAQNAFAIPNIEPWPEPIEGQALFAALMAIIRRYLVLADDAIIALILWIVHTHAFAAAQSSAILALLSPVPRCGKTTVLQVLEALCARPLSVTNLTTAGFFRAIAAFEPTLLLDEVDTYLKNDAELIGLLNRGHTRMGAVTVRNEKQGDTFVPTRYSLWAPKALAAIGTIPITLMDRSIALPMRRKAPHEHVERIRSDRLEEFSVLSQKIARWVRDNIERLEIADPPVPSELHSRAADSWRPLLAIADLVGGPWPELSRQSAVTLLGNEADSVSPAIQWLSDIREIFQGVPKVDAMPTHILLHALCIKEESVWLEANHGKQLSAERLAALIKPFGITPDKIRLPGEKKAFRGYRRVDFAIAFAHYLPPIMEHPEQAEHDVPGIPGAPGFDDPIAPDDETEKDQ